MGSNPSTVYWMDVFSHIFVVKICNVCSKRPKTNEKEAGVGQFFKKVGLSLFTSAVVDLHAVSWGEGPRALVTPVKYIRVRVGG